jgi:hypothetical protein
VEGEIVVEVTLASLGSLAHMTLMLEYRLVA